MKDLRVWHCLSGTVAHSSSQTVAHFSSFTVAHCCSWWVSHCRVVTDSHHCHMQTENKFKILAYFDRFSWLKIDFPLGNCIVQFMHNKIFTINNCTCIPCLKKQSDNVTKHELLCIFIQCSLCCYVRGSAASFMFGMSVNVSYCEKVLKMLRTVTTVFFVSLVLLKRLILY